MNLFSKMLKQWPQIMAFAIIWGLLVNMKPENCFGDLTKPVIG